MSRSIIGVLLVVWLGLSIIPLTSPGCSLKQSASTKETVAVSETPTTPVKTPVRPPLRSSKDYKNPIKAAPPKLPIARTQNQINDRCNEAYRLINIGYTEEAKKIYLDLLSKNRGADVNINCVIEGLAGVQNAEINALINKGNYEDAWKKTNEAAVFKESFITSGRPEAGRLWKWWHTLRGFEVIIIPYLRTLGMLLAAALLFVLIVYLIVKGLRPLWSKPYLDIDPFTIGSAKFSDAAAKTAGTAAMGRFEECLSGLCNVDKLKNPHVIDAPMQQLPDLPEIKGVPATINTVWTFLKRLMPLHTVRVKGSFEHDEVKGAGLSIKLLNARDNRYYHCFTVWQNQSTGKGKVCDLPDYLCLVEEAAATAYWKINLETKFAFGRLRRPYRMRHFRKAFGTTNVDSFCAAQKGLRLMEGDNDFQCEKMLRAALRHDDKNIMAWCHLGVLENKLAKIVIHQKKLRRLKDIDRAYKRAIDTLTGVKENSGNDPVAHIVSTFKLGVIEQDKYCLTGSRRAAHSGYELLKEAIATAEVEKYSNTQISEEYIDAMKIPFVFARIMMNRGKSGEDAGEIKAIEEKKYRGARIFYNLACYYSKLCQFEDHRDAASDHNLNRSLELLEEALKTDHAYSDKAVRDAAFSKLKRERKADFYQLVRKYGAKEAEPGWKKWLRLHLFLKQQAA